MAHRTGSMRKRVKVQKATKDRTAEGGFIEQWTTENTVWAKINPLSADERMQADRVKNIRTHRITMRYYSPGITGAERLLFGFRAFNIVSVVNVGERGCDTILDVKEVEFIPEPSDSFIFTVKTNNSGSSSNDQFTLPLRSGQTYNFIIKWGDGSSETITANTDITHTYANASTYTIEIFGTFPAIEFNNGGDRQKILNILNWGTSTWTTMQNSFYGCANLNVTATVAPVLSGVTNFTNIFRACALFNADIDNWDVSSATTFNGAFEDCAIFNQSLNSWDVSSVTSMIGMFEDAAAFNQDLDAWDVSSVTDMGDMFFNASSFNGDITTWDVSSVDDFRQAFRGMTAFNQDISSWNTASATSFERMFRDSTSFDQDLGSWDITNLTTAATMFSGVTLSTTNYNALLTGWESQVEPTSIVFDGGGSIPTGAGITAKNVLINTSLWTITDGV